mmetsp:Transcript_61796/g.165516  ORF Transcript_61796/g.165516 Transcript_61796/m.165516 type:complete len:394 (-) Transcript_61796:176-1357(-)
MEVAGIPLPWILRGVVACCFCFAVALFVRNRQPVPDVEVEEEDEACDGDGACVEAEAMPVPEDWEGGETGVSADAMHQLLQQVYACQEDPEPDDGLVYGKNAELRLRMRRRLRQQQEKEKKQEPVVVEELVDPLADKEALEGLLRELGEGPKQPKKKGATIKKGRRRKGAQPTSQGEEADAEVAQSGTEAATSPSGRVESPSPEVHEQPVAASTEAGGEEGGDAGVPTTPKGQAGEGDTCNGHGEVGAEAVESPREVEVAEAGGAETAPVKAGVDVPLRDSAEEEPISRPQAAEAASPVVQPQAVATNSDSPGGKSGRKASKKGKSKAAKETPVTNEAIAPPCSDQTPAVDTDPDAVRRRIALETEQDVLQKQMQILQSRLLEVQQELKSAGS